MPDSEIEACDNVADAMQLIEDAMQDDFEQRVAPELSDYDGVHSQVEKLLKPKRRK